MTTMDQSTENPANIRGVCFCCLADGSFKNMYQSFKWLEHSEVYADMMLNCYNINIGDVARDTKPLICEVCIVRLRDSLAFRKQVENSCEVMKNATSLPETNVFELPIQKWEGDEEDDSFNWDESEAREDSADEETCSLMKLVENRRNRTMKIIKNEVKIEFGSGKGLKRKTKHSKNKERAVKRKTKVYVIKDQNNGTKDCLILDHAKLCPVVLHQNIYMCIVCNDKFLELGSLEEHIDCHSNASVKKWVKRYVGSAKIIFMNAAKLKCNTCGDVKVTDEEFKQHVSDCHGADVCKDLWGSIFPFQVFDSAFICHVCKLKCNRFSTLNRHVSEHYSNFICDDCGKAFVTVQRLRDHVRKYHVKGEFDCKECNSSFPYIQELHNHINNFHRVLEKLPFTEIKQDPSSGLRDWRTERVVQKKTRKYVIKHSLTDGRRQVSLRRDFGLFLENAKLCVFRWNDSKFICAVCDEKFASLAEFHIHAKVHEGDDMETRIRKNHTKRKVFYMDITTLKCIKCEEMFSKSQDFKEHIIEKHGVEVERDFWGIINPMKGSDGCFQCHICEQSFNHFLMLTKHMNSHADFKCKDCGKPFINEIRLTRHAVRMHTEGDFACKQCEQIFINLAKLEYHVTSTHKKPVGSRCPRCSLVLPSFDAKMRHLVEIHKEEPNMYKCDMCPKQYLTSSLLTGHKNEAHYKERKHVCEVCGRGFLSGRTLKEHLTIHSGEKPYSCSACLKMFPRAHSLREHMKIHNNVRRFGCNICERRFIQKCSLKSHMTTHEKRGEV